MTTQTQAIEHTCDCGFTWRHGKDGSHICGPYYRERIAKLEAAIEADRNKRAEAVMTDEETSVIAAPFHSVYGFNDVGFARALLSAAQKVPEGVRALEFANHVINGVFDGGDWDGGALQSLAVQYGLLKPQEMQERCGECCCCADNGADFPTICYRKTYRLTAAPQPDKKENKNG